MLLRALLRTETTTPEVEYCSSAVALRKSGSATPTFCQTMTTCRSEGGGWVVRCLIKGERLASRL